MAFTVQDKDGNVDGANAYVEVVAVTSYWADRGLDLSALYTEEKLKSSIIQATDYLDARYAFIGYQLRRDQGTQFPRGCVGLWQQGLPPALLNACCALTQRAASGKLLMPDPAYDATGQKLSEISSEVGPIKSTKKYVTSSGASAASKLPEFPEITLMLQAAGLIASGNSGSMSRG